MTTEAPAREALGWVVDALRHAAGELAGGVGLPATTITRHLRTLREAGIVEVVAADGDARGRLSSLRVDPMVALQAWVDQVSAFWAEQLSAFKAHAERKARRG